MAVERLQKILSNAGVASRRQAEEMILAGRVAVNGKPATTLGARADPDVDVVSVDGVPVVRKGYHYIALNKPVGVVSTARDERGRPTVVDLVTLGEDANARLHPAGRLDMDSEGLMILTTDGALTDLLTHPRNEVEKEYLVEIDRPLPSAALQRCVRGIRDDGEVLRAASIRPVLPPDAEPGQAWLSIVLKQGKKREIRRMMTALGRKVGTLRRVRIGPLALGALEPGKWRTLSDDEVTALYQAAARTPKTPGPAT